MPSLRSWVWPRSWNERDFEAKRVRERHVEGAHHHVLGETLGKRRTARQELSELHGLRHEVGGRHDAVDQADTERVLGIDAPP